VCQVFSVIKVFLSRMYQVIIRIYCGVPGLLLQAVRILLQYAAASPRGSLTEETIGSILSDSTNAEECVTPYLSRLEGL
jgi:hypothetical protein